MADSEFIGLDNGRQGQLGNRDLEIGLHLARRLDALERKSRNTYNTNSLGHVHSELVARGER